MKTIDTKNYKMFINGEVVETNQKLPVINPATEEVFAYVPNTTKEILDTAVNAAKQALPN